MADKSDDSKKTSGDSKPPASKPSAAEIKADSNPPRWGDGKRVQGGAQPPRDRRDYTKRGR